MRECVVHLKQVIKQALCLHLKYLETTNTMFVIKVEGKFIKTSIALVFYKEMKTSANKFARYQSHRLVLGQLVSL